MKTCFLALALVCCSPALPPHRCAAQQTAIDARAELERVLLFVEQARGRVESNQALDDAVASARFALSESRYSDAVAELSIAVRLLECQGVTGAPDVERAEVLLTMSGE